MFAFDLIQAFLHAQAVCSPGEICTVSCLDQNAVCPASAFNPIAAAFATEGYWVQDHLIHYLVDTGMGAWAPLLYIIAAIGGLLGVALGAPPRMYMWFFMGPAIYAWLLDTRELASGVEWRVGDNPQDQREVWKMAESGLRNSWTFHDPGWIHHGLRVSKSAPPGANSLPHPSARDSHPEAYANVATFFLWFDELLSDTVQQMTLWIGAWDQFDNPDAGGDTTLLPKPNVGASDKNKWFLMSNSKWEILTNITDAKLHSAELRDAFVTFLSSECGDLLKESIDSGRFIALANAKGQNIGIDSTVMKKPATDRASHPYNLVTQNLMNQTIPTPRALVKLLSYNTRGSFRDFANLIGAGGFAGFNVGAWGLRDRIACDQYLYLLIHGFRWEAGHTLNQLIAAGPNNMRPSGVAWTLLYGWDLGEDPNFVGPPGPDSLLYYPGQIYFLENLILVHMFRNEMAMAPALTDQRYNTSEKALNFTLAYQRSIGQKSKWAEVYTWAMMIPYLQGVLLYLLSIAYPFACIIILMPGMHKAILTWMSFWAWVKLWDLGFAICVVLERSIWGMIGNNSNASRLFSLVKEMSNWGTVRIDCGGEGSGLPSSMSGLAGMIPTDGVDKIACPVPRVLHVAASGAIGDVQTASSWIDALRIFDRSLVLGANLDLDLANSYYIYIMAALYFAVPTVTGQLVLGARAGAAGMVNSALGGVAQEAGKMAGSGHGSEAVTIMSANMGSVGQAAYAKSLRQSGLGMQAIEYGNQAARESDAASAMGTRSSTMDLAADNKQRSAQLAGSAATTANAYAGTLQNIANAGMRRQAEEQAAIGKAAEKQADKAERRAERAGLQGSEGSDGGSKIPGASMPGQQGSDTEMGSAGTGSQRMSMGDSPGGGGNLPAPGQPGKPGPASGGDAASKLQQMSGKAPGAMEVGKDGKPASPSAFMNGLKGAGENVSGIIGAATQDWVMGKQMEAQSFSANANAAKADLAVASYGAGARSRGYEMAGSRMSQHAGFEAQQSEWEAKNAFANQISGQAVAMGHFVGGMNAGAKPTGSAEAMAMSGMLNTDRHDAKSAAFWSDPVKGQRFGNIQATENRLGREGGGDFVASQFNQYGFGFSAGGITNRSGTQVRSDSDNPFRGNQSAPIAAQQR